MQETKNGDDLTLPFLYIPESCTEIKINLKFLFSLFFEAPQRSMKIKIEVNFSFLSAIETFRVSIYIFRKPLTIFAKRSTIDF